MAEAVGLTAGRDLDEGLGHAMQAKGVDPVDLGIVRLARPYGTGRLEAAANRAIEIGARTYGSVKSILDNHLDRRPAQKRATDGTPILHSNIRGPRYYN